MSQRKTVTINGTAYDVLTGMPVTIPSKSKALHSHDMHKRNQKSHTLNRKIVNRVAKPAHTQPPQTAKKSPMITRFAPHPTNATKRARTVNDVGPMAHPVAQKAHQRMDMMAGTKKPSVTAPVSHSVKPATIQQVAPKPSQVIGKEAVNDALEKAPSHSAGAKHHKTSRKSPRFFSIASASLALLLLGGYFTYLNMPNLSVRVAAAQAGIDASYPSYRPDGYSLRGAVAYNEGNVSMRFAANAGSQNFTITQSKTNWDSSAVAENYVAPKWGDDKMVHIEHGLTIYAHEGNAVWVNNGILYTIEGDAPLSASQIRGIATSL